MKKPIAPARASACLAALALVLLAVSFPHTPARIVSAQGFEPAGEIRELAIEDGTAICILPQVESMRGTPGFGWVNKLTPPSYPATLRSITIGLNRAGPIGREALEGDLYRIVVYLDPEMNGPNNNQQPNATFFGRVRGKDLTFMTFNLATPITITSGSFVVGVIDEFGIADSPALFNSPGLSNPPGSESFFTLNGGASWRTLAEGIIPSPPCGPGSFVIRATIELNPVEVPTTIRVKDPAAVEPWGVAVGATDAFVTNLVSDNVTAIRLTDNAIQNIPISDPSLCPQCGGPAGPFGVVTAPDGTVFVSLLGSNTIPSKEFPIDYSTIGLGRVVALKKQANGSYQATGVATVGKAPMFLAIGTSLIGTRLYVPCAGANRVDVLSAATLQKIREIPVGPEPSSCTFSLTGAKVYVTNFGNGTISVISTATDTVVKTIPAPQLKFPQSIGPPTTPPAAAEARQPWMGAISQRNGNLYVTYWSSTAGDRTPNGAIVEFDTCKDEFLRFFVDDAARGSASGSAGASGIPAPSAPLTRNAATGVTDGAGGGGGGPFGITACSLKTNASGIPTAGQLPLGEPTILFTNDATGVIGAIDARIDQVVTAPPFSQAGCPKPRGIACNTVTVNNQVRHVAYVACGQPDSSVLVISIPVLARENIPGYNAIEAVFKDTAVRVRGVEALAAGPRGEIIQIGTEACLTFSRTPKLKKGNKLLLQKGAASDGRSISDINNVIYRIIYPDNSVRLIFP